MIKRIWYDMSETDRKLTIFNTIVIILGALSMSTLLIGCSSRNDGFDWGHKAIQYNEGARR